MIEAVNVSKSFSNIKAVDSISASIKEGTVFGLIGTNGAGKSTFLRMACGVLKPDQGEIMIDGVSVYENEEAKSKIFYISDDQHFFANATSNDMKNYYKSFYKNFNTKRYDELLKKFDLDANRKINTFSKGMKKQVSILCGICANTEYLFCDETFDGLDPVVRQAVKSIFANDMEERNLTPVVASHNLRELEDICDHVGLLHKGGILLSKDLEEMKFNIHKIQCVLKNEKEEEVLYAKLDILKRETRGSLLTITARGTRIEIVDAIAELKPVFYEILPLSLEEIFISETEVVGYDIKKLIF
ncbi:MAG: ABC transporter ATP-binding protein [Lachnotalea sp.]